MTGLQKETAAWILLGFASLVGGVFLLALAVRRFGGHLQGITVETPLFRRLVEVHGLGTAERKRLLEIARRKGEREPAVLFVSPGALGAEDGDLRARLFGGKDA